MNKPFVLWLTGPPASGKSTIAKAVVRLLHRRWVDLVVLESDLFRRYFAPQAPTSESDRALFYQGITEVAAMFVQRDLPVLIDATGNRRSYRQSARERLPVFAEVLVECPVEVCLERDTKGIYKKAATGSDLQVDFEWPTHPELRIRSDREDPDEAAKKIVDFLIVSGWIPSKKLYPV